MIASPLILMLFVLAGSLLVLSAEGRLQMVILLALFPAMLLAVLAVDPSYALTRFGYPELLVAMFVLMALGGLWMRRILNLDSSDST